MAVYPALFCDWSIIAKRPSESSTTLERAAIDRHLTGVSSRPLVGEIHVASGDASISDFVLQLLGPNFRRLFLFLNQSENGRIIQRAHLKKREDDRDMDHTFDLQGKST